MLDSSTHVDSPPAPPRDDDGLMDSRDGQGARRCQSHNVLMEPLGTVDRVAGYYCHLGDDVQLRKV